GSEPPTVRRKRDRENRVGMARERLKQRAGFYITEPDRFVVAGAAERSAVGTERNNVHRGRMSFEGCLFKTRLYVPEFDGVVGAAASEEASVWRKRDAADFACVTGQGVDQSAGGGVPKFERF